MDIGLTAFSQTAVSGLATVGVKVPALLPVIPRSLTAGDFASAGRVAGTLNRTGMFGTMDTPDDVQTPAGSGKMPAAAVPNFSPDPRRRGDLMANDTQAVELTTAAIEKSPNDRRTAATPVTILKFNLAGPVFGVRPSTSNADYGQICFRAKRAICEMPGAAGFPIPGERQYAMPFAQEGD